VFIKCDGQNNRGRGNTYLGLHGWSGDHTTFSPLIPYLPEDATLFSVDLPGYGASPPPAEWTIEILTAELVAVVEALPAERMTIVGNCSGAILALLAAPQIEARIERLVLIDPFAYVPWYFRVFVESWWGRYAYYTAFANPLGRWIANLSLRGHRAGETDLTASFREVDHGVSYRYLRLLCDIDGITSFAWLRKPIDILYGARTFGAIKESVKRWQGIWPQAHAHELAGAGQLPILEATGQLARIVFGPNARAHQPLTG
jgi:pimeloyl-ACP methyl ester carboxylesterase